MKNGKAIVDHVKRKGYFYNKSDNTWYPRAIAEAMGLLDKKRKSRSKHVKTGDCSDTRNLYNLENITHPFVNLVKQEFDLQVWPEFHFVDQTVLPREPDYVFDFTIPSNMIAIEVNGGIWKKGNSGHSSGKGIKRDMDKSSLAAVKGWTLISIEPRELMSSKTLDLIAKCLKQKKFNADHY